MCASVCWQHTWGGQRTTYRSLFSLPTLWVLRIQLRVPALVKTPFYLPGHLASSALMTLFNFNDF